MMMCIESGSVSPGPGEREVDLEARIAEIQKGLQCPCPSRYGEEQHKRDQERLEALSRARYSGLKLSMQEDTEEAWLTARVDSWSTIPEAAARQHS